VAEAVLDSSAALAFIRREPGLDVVAGFAGVGLLSAVNLTEVVSKLIDLGDSEGAAVATARRLPFHPEAHDLDLAIRAGALRTATRRHGLSFGDRACLALAQRERLPALTADRAWADLDIGVEIRLIR